MIKRFYVIRFDDGTYFRGTTPYSRRRVDFSRARVYNQENHAKLSIKELRMEDAKVIQLTIPEPDFNEKEVAPEEDTGYRAVPQGFPFSSENR